MHLQKLKQPDNFDFLFNGSKLRVTRDKFALPFLGKGSSEGIGKA